MARLTRADRIKMETLLNAGHSVQEVADELHVHRATIYREYGPMSILWTQKVERLCGFF